MLVLAVLMSLAGSTTATAQALLDEVWIRVNVRANGYSINDADDTIRRQGVFVAKCYMLINDEGTGYLGRIACENAPGVWVETGDIGYDFLSDGGGRSADDSTSFSNRKGQSIGGYGSHFLFPVFNKMGVLKQVQMRSWGEVIGGSLEPGVSTFWGGYNLGGVAVPAASVPAEVVALFP